MSAQYLVDFENVHEAGLQGMDLLAPEDSVYILHTSLMDKISLSALDNVQAWIRVVPVPPGSQSLDMHLASFLGYLIGKEKDPESQYMIVSNDMDYLGIASFWNKTYQKLDKVQCTNSIGSIPDTVAMMDNPIPFRNHLTVRNYIIQLFERHGKFGLDGKPSILLSDLCNWLNRLPEYIMDRKWMSMKPMQYLAEEHQDILMIRRICNQDWVFLLTENLTSSEPAKTPAAVEPAEEELPDIMDLGDLTIDTEITAEENTYDTETLLAAENEQPQDETEAVTTEEPEPEEPDCLTIALQMIRDKYIAGRNDRGHIRASLLRDELLKIPQFRIAMKDSGMRPIFFLKNHFLGKIDIYLEKGIYWAAESDPQAEGKGERKDVLDARKREFYNKAISNIQDQLSNAGMDQEVANEIADICLHSSEAVEPRKEIHNLLCQRFGPKIGAKYYRQTVKYMS